MEFKENTTYLEKVNFKPNTFLSELLQKKHVFNSIELNTNETKSNKRIEAEDKIKLFSQSNCSWCRISLCFIN